MQIKKLEDTIHVLDLKVKERDLKNKNLQDKVRLSEVSFTTCQANKLVKKMMMETNTGKALTLMSLNCKNNKRAQYILSLYKLTHMICTDRNPKPYDK